MAYKNHKGIRFFAGLLLALVVTLIDAFPSYAQPSTVMSPAQLADQEAAANYTQTATPVTASDPFEKYNRGMFRVNDGLDHAILKPVATAYNTIMPKPLNQGVHNFFNNLWNVTTIINDLLQFNFYQATSDTWRLGINTTIGIGGLFDVASRMGLPQFNNDFGLTLADWGWEDSTFIVWPLFGPSTLRDGIEIPVDYYFFSVYPYIEPPSLAWQLYFLSVVDRRAQLLKFQTVFEEAAYDKYTFARNAFLQRRAFQIDQVKHLDMQDRTIAPRTTWRKPNWPENNWPVNNN